MTGPDVVYSITVAAPVDVVVAIDTDFDGALSVASIATEPRARFDSRRRSGTTNELTSLLVDHLADLRAFS